MTAMAEARRVLREISIMRLCNQPNIVALKNVYALPGELFEQNLWCVIFVQSASAKSCAHATGNA